MNKYNDFDYENQSDELFNDEIFEAELHFKSFLE